MDFYNSRVASGHLDSFLPDSVDTSRKEQFSLCVPPVPQSFLVEPCINQLRYLGAMVGLPAIPPIGGCV